MSLLSFKSFSQRTKFSKLENINLLLTERDGCTGEYWPEVVTERTEHGEVRTKTTEDQYSPVRLEQAGLVSSLLYGTRLHAIYIYFFLTHFRSVKFKGLPARDDASNSERTSYLQATTTLQNEIIDHLPNVLPA